MLRHSTTKNRSHNSRNIVKLAIQSDDPDLLAQQIGFPETKFQEWFPITTRRPVGFIPTNPSNSDPT